MWRRNTRFRKGISSSENRGVYVFLTRDDKHNRTARHPQRSHKSIAIRLTPSEILTSQAVASEM
jgi:hypothetical protein